MAAIKPIEARSVHQIQSGQVIVDLCSVVKELVENSLDAGATSVEVRFKNNGLDAIEVQDNGSGISPSNWDSLALKHHTSKLATYDDLSSLDTFGFRGEALSSLCAVATFYAVTATSDGAPKGHRLDFASSGKLDGAIVVAAQTGTTAVVEGLFEQLPVRRKELAKNIKKEYGKALGLLHAYTCISANIKFTVKNSMPKGKNAIVFATKGNPTTKENIANVYGAKTLAALVPLDLQLNFQRSSSQLKERQDADPQITIRGHVSRPVFGEGRQTPDRQMFFVNGRPCGLPQISKAFNEVYKSFNVSQSPFVFADLTMDTNAYDVNVSPDKRTILLHDAIALVESLKSSLTELFDQQQQTVPQSQIQASHLPMFKQRTLAHKSQVHPADGHELGSIRPSIGQSSPLAEHGRNLGTFREKFRNEAVGIDSLKSSTSEGRDLQSEDVFEASGQGIHDLSRLDKIGQPEESAEITNVSKPASLGHESGTSISYPAHEGQHTGLPSQDLSQPTADTQPITASFPSIPSPPRTSVIQNAFDKMRPNRPIAELATITIGDKTTTAMLGMQIGNPTATKAKLQSKRLPSRPIVSSSTRAFTKKLKDFAASAGSQDNFNSSSEGDAASGFNDEVPSSDESQKENESLNTCPEDGKDNDTASNDMPSVSSPKQDSDGEYKERVDEDQDVAVRGLVRAAEQQAASLIVQNARRANIGLRPTLKRDSTTSLQVIVTTSMEQIQRQTESWQKNIGPVPEPASVLDRLDLDSVTNEEERLNLTISKSDFSQMHIVGQFNLGFILAIRTSGGTQVDACGGRDADELFIIDQHASDEKFNFERLQVGSVVGSQRLVRPKHLDLTAVEEEILIEHVAALEKNGFLVNVDESGDEPIGQRCELTSIPLSKQVAFGLEDLEELLHLLAEAPSLSQSAAIPRPSKVRKMFAMRACRSSIMIGKSLTEQSMRTVVSHMGEIDKPWNCPHGRPTMRHLITLNTFDPWQEGDGIGGQFDKMEDDLSVWSRYSQ